MYRWLIGLLMAVAGFVGVRGGGLVCPQDRPYELSWRCEDSAGGRDDGWLAVN